MKSFYFVIFIMFQLCQGSPMEPQNEFEPIEHPMDAIEDFVDSEETNRIFGGTEAIPYNYPFQIGLDIDKSSGKSSWCGATIISEWYALTAAHCIQHAKKVKLLMGMHNRSNSKEPGRQEQTVTRKNFIIHKSYNEDKIRNDIALIKFNKALIFTETVQPIALATLDMENLDGESATVIGWGYYNGKRILSTYLRTVDTEIISNSECQNTFGSSIRSTNICINGNKEKGSCNGDSGGPLIIAKDETYIQVGIVSFGSSRGCDKRLPSAFTRVTKYLDWIEQNSMLNEDY